MAESLRHRGPDDSGEWLDAETGIALAFRRLAIIDLTPTGHQPMESGSGRFVVVFNGEIYNFHELRQQLTACGVRFRGRSDTEVLLAAVETWGVRDALVRFNGMFAFALWDRVQRTLHLARDRAGEKPLYYGWMGNTLLFGSELKALRAHPAFSAQLDRSALTLFMQYGYVPDPHSIYRGVAKLSPGMLVSFPSDQPATNAAPVPYWSWRDVAESGAAAPFRGTEQDAVDALQTLLLDAVKIRMQSDVPLGAFLSGGIDSSTIVAMMQAQSATPVRTFTIGFHDERHNEAEFAAAVARHLGTEHTELYVTPDEVMAVIPKLPRLYDEPFADTSQIPTYLVSELARRQVTVSLSGDAGDELFGGYSRHQSGPQLWRGIRWMPRSLRAGAAAVLLAGIASPGRLTKALNRVTRHWTGKRPLSERLRESAGILPSVSPAAVYDFLVSHWKQPALVVHDAPNGGRSSSNGGVPHLNGGLEHLMMYLDSVSYLPGDILVKLDRASMGVSLEGRIPMLDPRVIEFAWRLPVALKIRHGTRKWALRQVLYRYVPRQLVDRPKRGFHVPIAEWLRHPLRDWAESLLDEHRLRQEGVFQVAPIRQKWQEHLAGTSRWDQHLWNVLMFQSWQEAFPRVTRVSAVA